MNARLRHVVIAVGDLERALHFYRGAFSWPQVVALPGYAELGLPGGGRLGLVERAAAEGRTGAEPLAVSDGKVAGLELYLDVEDVAAASHRLVALGGRLLSPSARRDWGDECAFVADPWGNVLALAHGEPAVDDAERLRAVVLRWLKLWQRGPRADFEALHDVAFVDHSPAGRAPTREGFRQGLEELYAAFPDFDLVVEDLTVDTAQRKVCVRWSATGTHVGTFAGVAPTGRTVVFRGMELVRAERDLVVERWGEWDFPAILEQLQPT